MGPLALLGIGAGISALGNVVNNLMSRSNAQFAYDKFNSPAAQVRGFQQAGMNPAVAMSESGGSSGGNQSAPPAPTENPFGMVNLETYANSLKALADAKKAGVDTRSAEEDIKLKQIEQCEHSSPVMQEPKHVPYYQNTSANATQTLCYLAQSALT